MLSWSENGLHLDTVGIGGSLELGEEVLELDQAVHPAHLAVHDSSPKGCDLGLQRFHVLPDSILDGLKGAHLLRRKAEQVLELQGQLHVLPQPRAHPVQSEPSPTEALLGRKKMPSPGQSQGQGHYQCTSDQGHDSALHEFMRNDRPLPPSFRHTSLEFGCSGPGIR